MLSGIGLCDELITCPEESRRLWCVIASGLETSRMGRPLPELGPSAMGQKKRDLYSNNYLREQQAVSACSHSVCCVARSFAHLHRDSLSCFLAFVF